MGKSKLSKVPLSYGLRKTVNDIVARGTKAVVTEGAVKSCTAELGAYLTSCLDEEAGSAPELSTASSLKRFADIPPSQLVLQSKQEAIDEVRRLHAPPVDGAYQSWMPEELDEENYHENKETLTEEPQDIHDFMTPEDLAEMERELRNSLQMTPSTVNFDRFERRAVECANAMKAYTDCISGMQTSGINLKTSLMIFFNKATRQKE